MTSDKQRTRVSRLVILALCISLPAIWACAIRESARGAVKAWDFGGIYYGARCAIRQVDPYSPQVVARELESESVRLPQMPASERAAARFTLEVDIYPPTALLMIAPLAALPWPLAQLIWISLATGLTGIAAYLAWDLSPDAPVLGGCLAGFMVLNSLVPLVTGNPAGIVIPLCVIATWCFLKDRFVPVGMMLLAVSLVIKPHDVGFVWLYFLLASDRGRKRMLQVLAATAVFGTCAAIWVAAASPHWFHELRGNAASYFISGGVNNPGPTGTGERGFSPIVSMQNAVSVFKDDPHFYNPVSYVIGGGLILAWMIAALRKRSTHEGTLLALAAISMLTMLPVYHRAEDAKLMLLAIPACSMLWAARDARRWVALGLTSAAILVTSDVPLIFWTMATSKVAVSTSTLTGKLTLLALQPAPVVLLAAGCFYLWVYIRYEPTSTGDPRRKDKVATEVSPAAAI